MAEQFSLQLLINIAIYKPKPKEETPQSENLETDQSLATVNEDNQSGNENGT